MSCIIILFLCVLQTLVGSLALIFDLLTSYLMADHLSDIDLMSLACILWGWALDLGMFMTRYLKAVRLDINYDF